MTNLNIEASLTFYRKMLGIEPAKVRTGYAKFDVQNPSLNLVLNEVPALKDAGALSHLGFQVASTDDVFAYRQLWADAGLRPSGSKPVLRRPKAERRRPTVKDKICPCSTAAAY